MERKCFLSGLFATVASVILLLFGLLTAVPAWGQSLDWVRQAGGNSIDGDEGRGIAVDGAGNSYVTGFFSWIATFGAGQPNETVLTSGGFSDIFVAKYDRSGSLLWVKQAGGSTQSPYAYDSGDAIAVDGAGNSYVTGLFQGSVTFGGGEPNETVLGAPGGGGYFLAKYDRNGNLIWATLSAAWGTLSGGYVSGIAVDAASDICVAGPFHGTMTFGSGEANQTTLSSSEGLFVAKYDRRGHLLWARGANGSAYIYNVHLASDNSGNSYAAGTFSGTVTFAPGEANQTALTSIGNTDIFVAKYDPDGHLTWATRAGGLSYDGPGSIAVDEAGNSYLSGSFSGTVTFGEGGSNQTDLTSSGPESVFLAKYDKSGHLLWATASSGRSGDIRAGKSGNCFVAGTFYGTATFGEGEDNETVLGHADARGIFVAKYDREGHLLWATQVADFSGLFLLDIRFVVNSTGNLFMTGSFEGTLTFDAGGPNETVLTSPPHNPETEDIYDFDVFVARFMRTVGGQGPKLRFEGAGKISKNTTKGE